MFTKWLMRIRDSFIIKNLKQIDQEFKDAFIKKHGVNNYKKKQLENLANETENFKEPTIYYYELGDEYFFAPENLVLTNMQKLDSSYGQNIFLICVSLWVISAFSIYSFAVTFTISIIYLIYCSKNGSPNKKNFYFIKNSASYIDNSRNEKINILR
jgi:hypothetical protein